VKPTVIGEHGSVISQVDTACNALTRPRHRLADARSVVPDQAGLYAIYGMRETWHQLGLGDPADDRPLYVGKAEQSLVTRDLNTHFRPGRTGQSTVRRTFAALLRDQLGLRGIPRNQQNPERPANFALNREHDAALQDWIDARIELAVWAKPVDCTNLGAVEVGVIGRWVPPLNLKDNTSTWSATVSAARRVMAEDARAWIVSRRSS
jgi:hypothetical protein